MSGSFSNTINGTTGRTKIVAWRIRAVINYSWRALRMKTPKWSFKIASSRSSSNALRLALVRRLTQL